MNKKNQTWIKPIKNELNNYSFELIISTNDFLYS